MACWLRRFYLPSTLLLLFLAALSRVLQTHRPSYASRAVGTRQLAMGTFFFVTLLSSTKPSEFLYVLETPS